MGNVIDTNTGRLHGNKTKVSDLIKYLQEHQEMYGDTNVHFEINGDDAVAVRFEHFKNAITVDVYEYSEDEDEWED